MSDDIESRFQSFFLSRALSVFGDELWLVAVPLYFAFNGYTARDVGLYSSFGAAGTVLGFMLLPHAVRHFKASSIALASDILQISMFCLFLAAFFVSHGDMAISSWLFLTLVISFSDSAWFGATESLIAKMTGSGVSQKVHRMNYLSANIGLVAAPVCAAALLAGFGLAPIAVLNILTFIFQIKPIKEIGHSEVVYARDSKRAGGLTLAKFLRHPVYLPMIFLTAVVKIALVGLLPFVAFTLAKLGSAPAMLWLGVTCFPAGSVIGALSYKQMEYLRIGRVFLFDALAMLALIAIAIVSIYMRSYLGIVLSVFGAGYFSARYTIEIRAMRQLITPVVDMAKLVSMQGLAARAVTPLSGLVFALLYGEAKLVVVLMFASLVLLVGVVAVAGIVKGFAGMLNEAIL